MTPKIHRGVVVPASLRHSDTEALDNYAAAVKAGNTAFIRSVFEVEEGRASATIARWDFREVGHA